MASLPILDKASKSARIRDNHAEKAELKLQRQLSRVEKDIL